MIGDLTSATERFAGLLLGVSNWDAPAVGSWSVAETAAHVRSVAALNAHFVSGDAPLSSDLADLVDEAATDTFTTHSAFTDHGVRWALETGVEALAAGVVEDTTRLAVALAERPEDTIAWLAGTKLPVAAVGAQMISELLVHGFDIARAAGKRFDVPDHEARHFFTTHVPAMVAGAPASGFFDLDRSALEPVAWKFRVRGGPTFGFVFRAGALEVVDPDYHDFDLTISARPGPMLLVMYDRIGPVVPALRGQVTVWGRRPWRLRRVMQVLQTP